LWKEYTKNDIVTHNTSGTCKQKYCGSNNEACFCDFLQFLQWYFSIHNHVIES